MSWLGLNISFPWTKNNYVRRDECHKAHDDLTKFLDAKFGEAKNLIEDLHRRIDDHQKAVITYIDLLSKK
jgi:hypothetical protein